MTPAQQITWYRLAVGSATPVRLARFVAAAQLAEYDLKETLPIVGAPAEVRAIVESAPLTWYYSSPRNVGGWLGAIEPEDESWIAFIGVDGKGLLWTAREEAGGVVGKPFFFWRPDLALKQAAAACAIADGLIPLGGPGSAPERFRIWKAGSNPGDYGDCNVTPAALTAVLAEQAKRGTATAIDIQHATNLEKNPAYDPANPPPIGGHAMLREVDGELWADPVRWTDCGRPFAVPNVVCCGKHQIETGQRPYISPDWLLNRQTREPVSLNRLSLVAEPGTYHVNMLAERARRTTNMDDLAILKALLAAAMAAAGSADPDVQACGATVAGMTSDLATAKGMDLSGAAEPPASVPAAALPMAGAAGCDPTKPAAGCDPTKPAAAAAAKVLPAVSLGAPGVTAADVERLVAGALEKQGTNVRAAVAEDSERRSLLEANKEILGNLVPVLANKPLADVKSMIAAVSANAEKNKGGGTTEDGAPRGAPVGANAPLTGENARIVKDTARRMGVPEAAVASRVSSGNAVGEVSLVERYAARTAANKGK